MISCQEKINDFLETTRLKPEEMILRIDCYQLDWLRNSGFFDIFQKEYLKIIEEHPYLNSRLMYKVMIENIIYFVLGGYLTVGGNNNWALKYLQSAEDLDNYLFIQQLNFSNVFEGYFLHSINCLSKLSLFYPDWLKILMQYKKFDLVFVDVNEYTEIMEISVLVRKI